jgi:hypothetical protein
VALIWRGIFEVEDDDFVATAVGEVESWLRWKLGDDEFELPTDGSLVEHRAGREITGREASEGDLSAFRASLFERREEDELRTTVTAFSDGHSSWAWVDLERWSVDAFLESWVPIAPGVVGTLLRSGACRRGPSKLRHEVDVATGEQGEELARHLLDPGRELPLVVVSPTSEERDGDMRAPKQRATELKRRLMGIAPVVVLGPGAVTALSGAMLRDCGEGFDVYGGAIRTYLPGITSDDSPRRHRFVPFHRMSGRAPRVSAEIIAAAIQRGACAQAPPSVWREKLRPLVEPAGTSDEEVWEIARDIERDLSDERAKRAGVQETLDSERETAAETERENSRLERRVAYLEHRMRELGSPAEPTPGEDTAFDPDFCGEVPPELTDRLTHIAFPEPQWTHADELDTHESAAWAKRAWRAFMAMEAYALAKANGDFTGNLRDYCAEGRPDAVPASWIALKESATTNNNAHYRALRTLPLHPDVCGKTETYMPAHVKIEQGGYPAPRIHFHDDTAGATGKVHVGYFGVHLDNNSKN